MSWADLIGPGRAIDTDRWFVVCANAVGSSYGSTNAASTNPATGRPWGSAFPEIRIADIVAVQKALLDHLGVRHLAAVTGHSFGGAQVYQWGVDHPHFMDALVPVIATPAMPGADGRKIVMLVPLGENQFLSTLERFLDAAVGE